MTTFHRVPEGVTAYVKGAPERVLPRCNTMLGNDGPTAFEAEAVLAEAARLANEGYRMLALAKSELLMLPEPLESEIIEQNLTFVGLVALIDPPRPEVSQAVADCLAAGITPVMITGDHPGTAMAIARRLGITDNLEASLSGYELAALSDDEFARRVASIRIYARVAPEQKLRIVKALQGKGEFVAMTGDGVNDAPALKRAGIGCGHGAQRD